MEKLKNKNLPYYFICPRCAESKGGKIPLSNQGGITMTEMTCEYCDGENQIGDKTVIPTIDFTWPNSKSFIWD